MESLLRLLLLFVESESKFVDNVFNKAYSIDSLLKY